MPPIPMTIVDKFRERFQAQFKENEPLAKHLNIRIGGPARYFVEARSTPELVDTVQFARDYAVPYFMLGGGSNTLVSDEGYDGLVIKVANRGVQFEGERVICDAGAISASIARMTADKGLRGFEWAISLPGTIGGAVRGNAGCFGGETRESVELVRVLRDGVIIESTNEEMRFGYRHSILKDEEHEDDVILDVTLRLIAGDRAEAMALIDKHLANRKASQPLGSSSCGCMFKNFEFSDEAVIAQLREKFALPEPFITQKRIPAGWIIDKLGLKGMSVGDAEVSLQHGNFLLNKGHASASDIAELVRKVKARVRDEVGIVLSEEVQPLGF